MGVRTCHQRVHNVVHAVEVRGTTFQAACGERIQ